ncbi:YetF domain-containing protein [Sporolactobacillus inulinus]|jgi:uncharacterized membrane protein YcaP (DUF421 family)|nr:YetF domain-containing protein [Sporolactobacillus inulinus]GEB76346.1 hypothetical protein SIN01_06910 [Sporolactobacillus inulinus]
MGTSVIRMVCLSLMITLGFRHILSKKIAELSALQQLLIFAAANLCAVAVAFPDHPLLPMLVPLIILLLIEHMRFWPTYLAHFIKGSAPIKKSEPRPRSYVPPRIGLSLIENGKIRHDHLTEIGKTQLWLRQELRKFGYRNIHQVNYLTMDSLGNFYMDLKKYLR